MSETIIVAVDASEHSIDAARLAAQLMQHRREQHVVLLHCLSQELWYAMQKAVNAGVVQWEEIERRQLCEVEKILDRAKDLFLARGVDRNQIEMIVLHKCVSAAREIVRQAEKLECHSLFLGRRGLSAMKRLLLGSTSDKVAQYAKGRTVWVVDRPVESPRKILVALDYREESHRIIDYVARFIGPLPEASFTFLHLIPQIPPAFWDDGRILGESEREERLLKIEHWIADRRQAVEGYFEKAKVMLQGAGVKADRIRTVARPIREGIARDIVNRIHNDEIDIAVIGKKSLGKGKPFLFGSHANKILHHGRGVALCLVDGK